MLKVIKRPKKRMRAWLRLMRARRGNVAITFAFTLIPLLALVGAAVDFSRANSVRTSLQLAVDSTALMLSKKAASATSDEMQGLVETYFAGLFKRSDATNIKVSAIYSATTGSQVVVSGSADMDTEFMRMIGYKTISLSATSTVKWGASRLRVALVLDTTGSMASDGKIAALITATKKLLDQLQSAASVDGDVYVSIIPFAKDVRIENNYDATWDDWIYWDNQAKTDQNSWDATHGKCNTSGSILLRSNCVSACSLSNYTTQSTCTAAGTCTISGNSSQSACTNAGTCSISGKNSQSTCTNAGTCSISGYSTKSACNSAGVCSLSQQTTQSKCNQKGGIWTFGVWTAGVWTAGVWTPGVWTVGVWTPDLLSRKSWSGCTTDRGPLPPVKPPSGGNAYDQTLRPPSLSDDTSRYPPEDKVTCPPAMMALSYKWSAMKTLVDGLGTNGSTNQPIGLVWGWLSLVGGGPFTAPPKDAAYQYVDAIILLSDGLNTQNRWDGNGSSTSTAVDARMRDSSGNGTCANINAANINLYTIQVNTGGDPTSTLLRNCAGTAPTETVARRFPDPSKFSLLTSADQIITTFDKIGTELTKLRIAR
jgi:Flp pilus assembly protein TadG